MKKDILLIFNPISGTRRDPGLPGRLCEALRLMGRDVELAITEYAGHARELASMAARESYRSVLACGGDGTVNEVAGALTGSSTILGILPNGSGNGLARHIGIPCNPERALSVVAAGYARACDWCDADGHPFFCAFGIGFDAAVAHRFGMKGSRGLSTYLRCAVEEFRAYTPQTYTLVTPEGEWRLRAMFISCCNASQFGNNAYIAPRASILDGKMDITVIEKAGLLKYVAFGINMMSGALTDGRGVRMIRAGEVLIRRPEPGIVHVDGEPMKLGAEVKVKVHPSDLLMYVNALRRPIRPWLTPLHLG